MSSGLYTNYEQGYFQQRYIGPRIYLPYLGYIRLVLIGENDPCKKDIYSIMRCSKIDWDNV